MPFTRRRRYARAPYRRPYRRNYGYGLATRPRFMNRTQKYKRWNNNSTQLFYLKDNGRSTTDLNGDIQQIWSVQDLFTSTPASLPQWQLINPLYSEFKVLAMTVRFFPANVGIEPHDQLLGQDQLLLRGNQIVWSEQRPGSTQPFPSSIDEVICQGSARMIAPRRPYRRTIYRPKGFTQWARLETPTLRDSWQGTINLLVNEATPAPGPPSTYQPVLWYWTRSWKILMRGRRMDS